MQHCYPVDVETFFNEASACQRSGCRDDVFLLPYGFIGGTTTAFLYHWRSVLM